jgi:predicted O-linked N-acetylglucosamine transferase (SPINDLY family)
MEDNHLSDSLVSEGVIALQKGDFSTARVKFTQAAQKNPDNVDAFYNLGAAELNLGNVNGAVNAYKKALAIAPTDYEVLYNLGTVYLGSGDVINAIKAFKESIDINPYYINALNNLGVAYQYVNDLQNSTKIYEQVIQIKDDDPTAYNNLGVSISKQGLPGDSLKYFQKAIELSPNYDSAHNNLGNALQQLGAYNDAVKYYNKALEINPNYPEALINLASTYHELRDLEKSIACYERVLEIDPENDQFMSHFVHIYQQVCDFEKIKEYKKLLNIKNQDPLMNIMYSDNLAENLKVAKHWSSSVSKKVELHRNFTYPWKHTKTKIGYLNNFQDKPVGYLIKDMFKLHDRRKFEIFAFSYGSSPGGDFREEVAKDVDHFVDLANITHKEAAKLINQKEIDILVDLKGHTRGERMEVVALRPSPAQITYLGYPGTTGADFFDYIITDRILTPPAMQKYYTEKFLYINGCYQIYSRPKFQKLNVKKSDYGLPEGKIVFSCFNQSVKIDEKVFSSWMKILRKTQDTVLWLQESNKVQVENLASRARKQDINPERIIWAKIVPFFEHLSRIPLADIALDPFTYSGGATTAHTLWMGVPVVTKIGKHYLSRMSSSIVTNVGLKQLAVKTPKEYEDLAVALATDRKKLKSLKELTKRSRTTSPLFNTKYFVRELEKQYATITKSK